MTWAPKIPPCPKPLREFFQAIIDRIDASWPISGFGIAVTDAAGGRSINRFGGSGSVGPGGAEPCNLRCSFGKNPQGVSGIRISLGRIQGILPDEMTADGMFINNPGGAGIVYGVVKFDFANGIGGVDSVTAITSKKAITNKPTIGYIVLARFDIPAGQSEQKMATFCGDVSVSICDLPDA